MLHEKAIAILDKFKTEASKPSDYVFPIVPNELNEKDLIELDLQISRGTARINKDLKIIATKAEINKPLSTHIIRHTFATLALSLGISTEIIQKILGHSNIRETQIYAKMLDTTVDEQMKKFKF